MNLGRILRREILGLLLDGGSDVLAIKNLFLALENILYPDSNIRQQRQQIVEKEKTDTSPGIPNMERGRQAQWHETSLLTRSKA